MSRPVVSVVLAVYNMADFLETCLESIWDQTIGVEHLEVIAVDDGSDDGSLDLLDTWAATHPELVVVRHARSGAPGAPRNRGLELSRGTYVFFADPDDYFGPEALERMVDAAERDGSEVVLGRIRGVGRLAAARPFMRSVAAGDVLSTAAVWSLTAHKLFARDLLVRHGLRFAEGPRLAEEQPLVVPALFLASSISVVADYDCYYLVNRSSAEQLTQQTADPATFFPIVRSSLDTVIAHVADGPERDALMSRWVEVELSRKFSPRFAGLPEHTQVAFLREARQILEELVPERVDLLLPVVNRLRIACVRRGSAEHVHALGVVEEEGPVPAPLYDGDRVLAPWPGLRDPQWDVPDAYYDITGSVAPSQAGVSVRADGRSCLEVRVEPATPVGRSESTTWQVRLRRDEVEHRAPVSRGAACVDLQDIDPAPGRWAVLLVALGDKGEEAHAVGDRGTRCEVPDGSAGLVNASLGRTRRGALWVDVRDDVPVRPVLPIGSLRWRGLEVALPAPDARGGAVLELRSGERRVRVPLVLSSGVLAADLVVGERVPPGRWSMWVLSRHPGSPSAARVRAGSVDAGPWRPSGTRVVRLTAAGENGWARLEVVGRRRWARRTAGRVLGPLRRRGSTTTA